MSEYYFKDNEFVIEQYDKKKTFSSFLPGIAGKRGIPLWAFYVNRGQGIASFGIENKDRHILEFSPAVKAYQQVAFDGFRTFAKINGTVTEIFNNSHNVFRTMRIKRHEFTVEEINHDLGLKFEMTYFGLPNESFASLVRIVNVSNLTDQEIEFELIDGVAQLLPTGVNQFSMKGLANLVRSWMDVYHLDKSIGFYKMRSSSADTAEVVENSDGNFYVSSFENELVKPIADPDLVFGYDTSKQKAVGFEHKTVQEMLDAHQATQNKIPVGFSAVTVTLKPNKVVRMNTLIGHAYSDEFIIENAKEISQNKYVDLKRQEAEVVLDELLTDVETVSNIPIFDDYIKQNYLDNILRGGYPMILKNDNQNMVYHLYSRRHGDLERDYNFFSIAPEFYSQGNGSFRDVCQNRRSDILLNPNVKDFNMKMFASFIQADGYNPLSIDGSSFEIGNKKVAKDLSKELFNGHPEMTRLLEKTFTPGSIINTMTQEGINIDASDEQIFDKIFPHATQNFEAKFGEGYWIDHWTYILDLVENYESIYPDKMSQALYHDRTYKTFDSPVTVLPRSEKICLTSSNEVRRFGSIQHFDNEKMNKLHIDQEKASWFKDRDGNIVYSSLFEKLVILVVNKITQLDPSGIGLEMEAEKPGWNDAMNGLPGLFGSGVSETIELKRVVDYLINHVENTKDVFLPVEFTSMMIDVNKILQEELDDFRIWNRLNDTKETYRKNTRFGTNQVIQVNINDILECLKTISKKTDMAMQKALRLGDGIYPTYLVHTVTDYEMIIENGQQKIGHYGLPSVTPKAFKVRALPLYLEAPARALKVMNSDKTKKMMFDRIKSSNIYDQELKFYKTSEFLDNEKNEIGRGRSFTKGWQERESNFLHMTYKYLLGLLKGKLYNEFFNEIKTNLTIFMDPKVYGRSTLENSSFIASSINPDPNVRGQGFVARLSGSTAEMISMWALMMYGSKPFIYQDGKLKLSLKPVLTKDFFKNQEISFMFLGKTKVTYINESNIDTFDKDFIIKKYIVDYKEVSEIKGKLAEKVREGLVKSIKVYF